MTQTTRITITTYWQCDEPSCTRTVSFTQKPPSEWEAHQLPELTNNGSLGVVREHHFCCRDHAQGVINAASARLARIEHAQAVKVARRLARVHTILDGWDGATEPGEVLKDVLRELGVRDE